MEGWEIQLDYEFTVEEVAEMYGVSESDVQAARRIRIHGIPELIRELQKGNLDIDQALRLSAYDQKKQFKMLQRERRSFGINVKVKFPVLDYLGRMARSFVADLPRPSIRLSDRNQIQQS